MDPTYTTILPASNLDRCGKMPHLRFSLGVEPQAMERYYHAMPRKMCGIICGCLSLFLMVILSSCKEKADLTKIINKVEPFEFTSQTAEKISHKQLLGKVWIANFFFTGCSIQCVQLSRRMAQIQELAGSTSNIVLVSFTVDPDTDTTEALKEYAEKYKADPKRWYFVTGEKEKLHRFIQTSFLLPASDNPNAGLAASDDFIHSEIFALVDQNGNVRAYYDGLDPATPAKIVTAASKLSAERQTP
jgi:protein SCO1